MSYAQQNANSAKCATFGRTSPYPPPPSDVCATAPQCEPRSLEQLVGNVVDYVSEISNTRAQAAAIRERLAGSWPEATSAGGSPTDPGLLGALGQFQGQAWNALWELRDHLNAIQKALG